MTSEEIRDECRRIIAAGGDSLIMKQARGVTMCRGRGPRGKLLDDAGSYRVVRYDAAKVLKWIESWLKEPS